MLLFRLWTLYSTKEAFSYLQLTLSDTFNNDLRVMEAPERGSAATADDLFPSSANPELA